MCVMFDERMDGGGYHVTDREAKSRMPSVEELKDMGVPDREIQACMAEYNDAKDWRELELQAHKNEFAMESKTVQG